MTGHRRSPDVPGASSDRSLVAERWFEERVELDRGTIRALVRPNEAASILTVCAAQIDPGEASLTFVEELKLKAAQALDGADHEPAALAAIELTPVETRRLFTELCAMDETARANRIRELVLCGARHSSYG